MAVASLAQKCTSWWGEAFPYGSQGYRTLRQSFSCSHPQCYLFIYVFILNLSIAGMQSRIGYFGFRCSRRWFNIFVPYRVITPLILAIICHPVNLSPYYWLYSPSLFPPSLPLPSGNHPFGLCFYESVFISVCLFVCCRFHIQVKPYGLCISLPKRGRQAFITETQFPCRPLKPLQDSGLSSAEWLRPPNKQQLTHMGNSPKRASL